MLKVSFYSVLALALAGEGLAHAQETTTEEGATEGGTTEGTATGEGTVTTSPDADMNTTAYPMEEVHRPIQLVAGQIEAGIDVALPSGPDDTGSMGLGNWMGLRIHGDYGINDEIQAGVRIPLALVKPDLGGFSSETLGGFIVEGMYSIMPMLSARVDVGFALPGAFGPSPFFVPVYFDADGMKLGFTVGASIKKEFGNLAFTADPALVFHSDAASDDMGSPEMLQVLQIPVALHMQVQPALAVGVRTGIYTGHKFKFGAKDDATLPVVLEGQYTLMQGMLDVGAQFGFASLLTDDQALYTSIGDTIFVGVFATWRNK
jgi:hypothetical protein